jgi:FSR family fosmidomycin resistance protein-like MFS transporter
MSATTTRGALWTKLTTGALLLGLVHAFVDMASGFLIFRDLGPSGIAYPKIVLLVVLYNSLAFAGQVPAGWLTDRFDNYRGGAIFGALAAATALVLSPTWPVAGIVIVGIGNAFFHVGAGALVLRASDDRATESGVFVGPGAVGLFLGIWAGAHPGWPLRGAIIAGLILSAPFMVRVARSVLPSKKELPAPRGGLVLLIIICAACLLGSVTVRSLVGGTIAGTWRGVSTEVMAGLALAACGGKMLGGFVSDRLGWTTISVGALVLSAPLITVLVGTPAGAVIGMLLFQMTMPVTLKAMHHVLPSRPGLAFGIPCLALIIGALPGLLGYGHLLRSWPLVAALAAVSTVMIFGGLRLLVRVGAAGGPAPELAARLRNPSRA